MKRYYFGISVGIIIMLILPVSVIANSMEYNSYKISGYIGNDKNSEDPYTTGSELYIPSYHPQIDAIRISNNHYTGIVFVSEIGYAQQIRIALNLPSVGWWFAWIDSDEDLDQDHPDIQFYVDYRDSSKVKAIVVWQQRLEDEQYGTNDDWDIQGCIIDCSSSPPTIGSSFSISDNNDENDKYPKVATESYSGGDSKVFF
ncbi:MAG: hypothetical protein QCI82_00015 [Candidatus Thermoplasmatota archaeon]|nr:hypothetical protein [Candidatus Thermoplasmatota archaeon]